MECCRREEEEEGKEEVKEEVDGKVVPDVHRQRPHRRESSAIQHIKIPMMNRKPVKFRCKQN